MFSKNLSTALIRFIDDEGITQEELAERCNLSARFVGNVIRGHSQMRLDTFENICAALEVTPNDILVPKCSRPNDKSQIMQVSQIFYVSDVNGSFPVCPACRVTIEREYQSYCDRCGQRLGWKHYKTAEVIDNIEDIK